MKRLTCISTTQFRCASTMWSPPREEASPDALPSLKPPWVQCTSSDKVTPLSLTTIDRPSLDDYHWADHSALTTSVEPSEPTQCPLWCRWPWDRDSSLRQGLALTASTHSPKTMTHFVRINYWMIFLSLTFFHFHCRRFWNRQWQRRLC